MKKKKVIGISIGDPSHLWFNGIHQNAHTLAKMLEHAGYEIILISAKDQKGSPLYETISVKTLIREKIPLDMFLSVSSWLPTSVLDHLKENFGTKIVSIQYGNYFETFQESLFHNRKLAVVSPYEKDSYCDELWISPHFKYTEPFLQTVYPSVDIKVCPYIWNEEALMARASLGTGNPFFDEENNIRRVTIHEPNISYMKNCFIPLCIASRARSHVSSLLDIVSVFNVDHLAENSDFIEMGKSLRLEDILTANKRYSIPWMATNKLLGTPITHQRNCELNYMPLEFFHLGFPVVHNCAPFKDAGYFYEGIDVAEGALKLIEAVETHRSNLKEYNERSKEVIWRYHSDNPKNIQGYVKLIEEVLG